MTIHEVLNNNSLIGKKFKAWKRYREKWYYVGDEKMYSQDIQVIVEIRKIRIVTNTSIRGTITIFITDNNGKKGRLHISPNEPLVIL